jgi:hypothetical protein
MTYAVSVLRPRANAKMIAENAKALASAIDDAAEAFDTIDALRTFLSPVNLGNFRRWNRHEGCPIRIYMDHEGSNILIGREENNRRRFSVDSAFNTVLRRPDILQAGGA